MKKILAWCVGAVLVCTVVSLAETRIDGGKIGTFKRVTVDGSAVVTQAEKNQVNGYLGLDDDGNAQGIFIPRTGTSASINSTVLGAGEIATTNDTFEMRIGDNSTAGGKSPLVGALKSYNITLYDENDVAHWNEEDENSSNYFNSINTRSLSADSISLRPGESSFEDSGTYIIYDPDDEQIELETGIYTYYPVRASAVVVESGDNPETGMIQYNSTDTHFWGYNGMAWKRLDN